MSMDTQRLARKKAHCVPPKVAASYGGGAQSASGGPQKKVQGCSVQYYGLMERADKYNFIFILENCTLQSLLINYHFIVRRTEEYTG